MSHHIEPVKGHILALAPTAGAPRRVLRTRHGYVAPKARWTLAGSNMVRGKADTEVDRHAVEQLRAMALSLAPRLADAPEVTAWAGVRPGTPDDAPMIGETTPPGVFALLGLYRNGVLLAPAAAELLAGMMLDDHAGPMTAAFDPRRFDHPRFDKRSRP
jgi:glycine oxidase